jgi:hypothetical protein
MIASRARQCGWIAERRLAHPGGEEMLDWLCESSSPKGGAITLPWNVGS